MKRKIELQTLDGLKAKVESDESLTLIEALADEFLRMGIRHAIESALQQAYDQGYEDAKPKWLPIDSAPKDGTVVDLFINGDRWPDCKFENGEWLYFSEYGDHMYDPDYYPLPSGNSPTHWMPLPEIE